MTILRQRYDDVSEIPEKYRDLYDQHTGELFDIPGAVPESEVKKAMKELADEREAHRLSKARLWDAKGRPGLPDDIRADFEKLLDR